MLDFVRLEKEIIFYNNIFENKRKILLNVVENNKTTTVF